MTPKTEPGRCRDCKWWVIVDYGSSDNEPEERECVNDLVINYIESDGGFSFNPPQHFGCIHWEEKCSK